MSDSVGRAHGLSSTMGRHRTRERGRHLPGNHRQEAVPKLVILLGSGMLQFLDLAVSVSWLS